MRSYHEEHYALQAAVAGQGLVLASSVMVSDMVDNGLLVAYRPEVRVPGAAYSVLCAPGRERHPPVRAFSPGCSRSCRRAMARNKSFTVLSCGNISELLFYFTARTYHEPAKNLRLPD